MKKDGNQISDTIFHQSYLLMNTRLDIIIWGVYKTRSKKVAGMIFEEIKNIESILNRYDSKSEVSRFNNSLCGISVSGAPILTDAITKCQNYYEWTRGYFNVFRGDLYDNFKKNNILTDQQKPNPHKDIQINKRHNTITKLTPNISLDFGGIGKGIALDKASEILEKEKIDNAFISFGGSSVITRGTHPHGAFWPFSLREQDIDEVWQLNDDAISVSSNQQENSGHEHILNPVTGQPVSRTITTCVQCKSSATDAEVLSTTLIVSPPALHEKITETFGVTKFRIYTKQQKND